MLNQKWNWDQTGINVDTVSQETLEASCCCLFKLPELICKMKILNNILKFIVYFSLYFPGAYERFFFPCIIGLLSVL